MVFALLLKFSLDVTAGRQKSQKYIIYFRNNRAASEWKKDGATG